MKTQLRKILENAPKKKVRNIGEIVFRGYRKAVAFDRFEGKFIEFYLSDNVFNNFIDQPWIGGLKRSVEHAKDLYSIAKGYGIVPALQYELKSFRLKRPLPINLNDDLRNIALIEMTQQVQDQQNLYLPKKEDSY